jgi:hypothetical protein
METTPDNTRRRGVAALEGGVHAMNLRARAKRLYNETETFCGAK